PSVSLSFFSGGCFFFLGRVFVFVCRGGGGFGKVGFCGAFGPETREGLWLYHVLGPDTLARMCERVSGAASGALYANESGAYFALRKRISKPDHHTWRSYAMFLLDVMTERTADHYRNNIAFYLRLYQTTGPPDDTLCVQAKNPGRRDTHSWKPNLKKKKKKKKQKTNPSPPP
ncbi:hypothetical protein C4813_23950, partial [Salmonella enterica subsp. enterica serovar Rubislaw]|uniref:DUF3440 domain-containing protein n=1 Tax=Salmonella enterica TaxID=28901 RepID=UPI000D614097